jgi:hypothetical protein
VGGVTYDLMINHSNRDRSLNVDGGNEILKALELIRNLTSA